MHVHCIRTGWPSIVIVKFGQMNILTHENVTLYGGVITCLLVVKFGQMNILTHENVTLYGGVITCLLACDSVCSTRR